MDRRRIDRLRADLEARILRGQFSVEDLSGRLEAATRRLRRLRGEAVDLQARIAARYAELAADRAVERALGSLGSPGEAAITLGPIAGPTEELRRIEASLERATSEAPYPVPRLDLTGANRVRGLIGAADLLLHDVAIDSGRLATSEHERVSRKRRIAEQELKDPRRADSSAATRTGRTQVGRTPAGAGNAPMRTESLLAEEARAHSSSRDLLDRLAVHQDLFLRIIEAARRSLDAIDEPLGGADAASSTRGAGSSPRSRGGSRDPASDPYARRLRELEKVIQPEKIAVDVDRGLIWIDATIEGARPLKMVVEPESEVVRLTAATALEAGIVPPEDPQPTVPIATIDGRAFAGRRVWLESVQIGSRVIHDVECLIWPPEFGDAPPSIGGGLLDRFSARVDPVAGTLTLTQLQVKPILRVGEQRR